MRKKTLLLISTCFTGSVAVVLIIFFMSYKINHSKNGFIRLIPPHTISSGDVLDIKFNSYYVAGASPSSIYLGNYTAPTDILVSAHSLKDTHYLRLKMPLIKAITGEGLIATIDSPNTYLIDRISASFFSGNLRDSCKFLAKLDTVQFSLATPVSSSSCIIRTFNPNRQQSTLTKVELYGDNKNKKSFLLEKQVDGFFSTDGMMHFDPKRKNLIYIYYYRNQFFCLDSNLKQQYLGKTIDTVTIAKIKVAKISSEQVSTMSAPPVYVNKKSCVSDDYLFVHSGLAANNEDPKLLESNSVIDVYLLNNNGKYKFSFYLPKFADTKLSDFYVYNKTLFAIYGHFLLTYKLNF